MIYCVDIRDYFSGNTIETILETTDCDEAYARADSWNKENGVTGEQIDSFYNDDILMLKDGYICKKFADVYQDETR